MSLTVYLLSAKNGEIKRFLERYYQKEVYMDEDVTRWIYVYNKPLEAVDIISAVIDNNDQYSISVCIQIDEGDIYHVNQNNHNDVVKGIFCLFYK